MKIIRGTTSVILRVKITDATGSPKTGLSYSDSGLVISTIASTEASATKYTSAGSTTETISTIGTYAAPTATKCRFKEISSTDLPGIYEIQLADARFSVSNATSLVVSVFGVSGMAQSDMLIELEDGDYLLKRDMSAVTGEAARSLLNALRVLRNKWSISTNVLTVCKEDDSTTAWTSALTTASGGDPINSSDPNT